jgi:hypothetical protein
MARQQHGKAAAWQGSRGEARKQRGGKEQRGKAIERRQGSSMARQQYGKAAAWQGSSMARQQHGNM